MQKTVYLQPLGPVDPEVLSFLMESLSSIPMYLVKILPQIEVPIEAHDPTRGQFDGSLILGVLPDMCDAVLGVIDADAYVEGLNYIFGLAANRRAIISLTRLRPEFYGFPQNDELFKCRALKEAVHELGHVFGLNHCPDRNCVMYFSNSIIDTDFKDWRYCGLCDWDLGRTLNG